MDLNLINDLDLDILEEELKSNRLNFSDVANYVSSLNIDDNNEQANLDDYQQSLKLIKISQILLRIATNKEQANIKDSSLNETYIYQCTNCSKAFRKSEYLENHVQRRHASKSLAENGLFPLIEHIKKYNNGLFVESSSIYDLKEEIKNLQTCLKETCEDLMKEKIAREQLQKIIESEIIEKLNSLQETWSVEPVSSVKETTGRSEQEDELNKRNEELNGHVDDKNDSSQSTIDSALPDHKDGNNFNLFLAKQNELIDKLGQNIDRFVKSNHNESSKLNDEQLQYYISTVIHKEIESLLAKESLTKETPNNKNDKDVPKDTKFKRRFLIRKDNTKIIAKEDELKRLSLHEFSMQQSNQHLNNRNLVRDKDDHTDEIVNEINQIVNEDLFLNKKASTIGSKSVSSNRKFRFPFKFRKSKSLNQLAVNEEEPTTQKDENESKENGEVAVVEVIKSEEKNNRNENELKLKEEKPNESKVNADNKPISRFRQFVMKKKDNEIPDNKISLTKFSSKQTNNKNDQISNQKSQKEIDELNGVNTINETDDKRTEIKQLDKKDVTQNYQKIESKQLKSVLKKSNSADINNLQQNNKMPKRIVVFNDERIEFSAEELDSYSSDTESNYSFTNNNYLSPQEQAVTIQKVVEKSV